MIENKWRRIKELGKYALFSPSGDLIGVIEVPNVYSTLSDYDVISVAYCSTFCWNRW